MAESLYVQTIGGTQLNSTKFNGVAFASVNLVDSRYHKRFHFNKSTALCLLHILAVAWIHFAGCETEHFIASNYQRFAFHYICNQWQIQMNYYAQTNCQDKSFDSPIFHSFIKQCELKVWSVFISTAPFAYWMAFHKYRNTYQRSAHRGTQKMWMS